MIFAALHFAIDPLLVALVVFAVIAAIGCAHALANARKEGIKKAKAFYRVAKMCHDAGATHHEKYYLAKATGDLFEAAHQTRELEELALNPKQCEDILDRCSLKWLEHEALDPVRRRKIIHEIEQLEKHHHGDEIGTLEATIAKILKGVKETATVPDGSGGTTTVPVVNVYAHPHPGANAGGTATATPPAPAAPNPPAPQHPAAPQHAAAPAAPATEKVAA